MADPGPPPEPPAPSETTFSDDPLEHSNLAAIFMVLILVTWLVFGHKIQGMFSWCALAACLNPEPRLDAFRTRFW